MIGIDERLVQYCKDNDFPIEEMEEDYFKAIESSFGYQRYLLAKSILELHREIARHLRKAIKYALNKIDSLLK